MDKDFFEEIFNFSVQRIRKAAKKSPGNQQKQKKESAVKRTIDWLYELGGGRNVPVRSQRAQNHNNLLDWKPNYKDLYENLSYLSIKSLKCTKTAIKVYTRHESTR